MPADQQARWVHRLSETALRQSEQDERWQDVLTALLQILLVDVARLAAPHAAGQRERGQPVLARVFEVMDESYGATLSTADVGRAVGLTAG